MTKRNPEGENTNELLKVSYDSDRITVSARELHRQLGVSQRFSVWVETNSKGFVENEDVYRVYLKVRSTVCSQEKMVH